MSSSSAIWWPLSDPQMEKGLASMSPASLSPDHFPPSSCWLRCQKTDEVPLKTKTKRSQNLRARKNIRGCLVCPQSIIVNYMEPPHPHSLIDPVWEAYSSRVLSEYWGTSIPLVLHPALQTGSRLSFTSSFSILPPQDATHYYCYHWYYYYY